MPRLSSESLPVRHGLPLTRPAGGGAAQGRRMLNAVGCPAAALGRARIAHESRLSPMASSSAAACATPQRLGPPLPRLPRARVGRVGRRVPHARSAHVCCPSSTRPHSHSYAHVGAQPAAPDAASSRACRSRLMHSLTNAASGGSTLHGRGRWRPSRRMCVHSARRFVCLVDCRSESPRTVYGTRALVLCSCMVFTLFTY